MADLSAQLFQDALDRLSPNCVLLNERYSLLASLFYNEHVLRQIEFEGNADDFGTKLIRTLSARQLVAVLRRLPAHHRVGRGQARQRGCAARPVCRGGHGPSSAPHRPGTAACSRFHRPAVCEADAAGQCRP